MRHPAAVAGACIRMLRPCHLAGVRTAAGAAGAGHDRHMRAAMVDIAGRRQRRRSHAAGAVAVRVVDKASGRHREGRGYRHSWVEGENAVGHHHRRRSHRSRHTAAAGEAAARHGDHGKGPGCKMAGEELGSRLGGTGSGKGLGSPARDHCQHWGLKPEKPVR